MHHLLWEPALGPERFFELYCETWRRSVLNLNGRKSLWQWLREVDPRNALFLIRALRRTQRMMEPAHYLAEYDALALGHRPTLPRAALPRTPVRTRSRHAVTTRLPQRHVGSRSADVQLSVSVSVVSRQVRFVVRLRVKELRDDVTD